MSLTHVCQSINRIDTPHEFQVDVTEILAPREAEGGGELVDDAEGGIAYVAL
jgi:hypothetical protein